MRTIPPEPPELPPVPDESVTRELVFRFVIPFRLFGSAWFLGFLMGRELRRNDRPGSCGIWGRIAGVVILAMILFIVISGVFFVLYLIKSILGINLFTDAHLME